jgi:GNAT superfamily N-acetyltransferase
MASLLDYFFAPRRGLLDDEADPRLGPGGLLATTDEYGRAPPSTSWPATMLEPRWPPANQLSPLARQVMTNPVGTETTSPYASQSVGVPSGPFNPIEAMTTSGQPILGTDMDRARARVAEIMQEAPAMVLGMVGDAPGGKTGGMKTPDALFDWTPGGGSKTAQIGKTEITYGLDRAGDTGEVILVKTPAEYRGQGQARDAMQQFVAHADTQGTTLFLNADPMDKGVSKGGLDRFYRSLGFVKNMGKRKDFRSTAEYVRQPQTQDPDSGGTGAVAGTQQPSQ